MRRQFAHPGRDDGRRRLLVVLQQQRHSVGAKLGIDVVPPGHDRQQGVGIAARGHRFGRAEVDQRLAREVPGKTIKEMEDLLALSYEAFLVKLSRWQDVQIVESEEGDE